MIKEAAFTLIELLVSMAVIGILSAIAIPQYTEYKARGFDIRAESDLRTVALAEEAYFLDEEDYLACQNDTCSALPGVATLSKGVTLSIATTEFGFTGEASHPKGSGKTFLWDSNSGGLSIQK